MTYRDVVLYFAIFALIVFVGMRWMDRKAAKQNQNDAIARRLRAFSDEFDRGAGR